MKFFVACLLLIAGVTAQPYKPYMPATSLTSSSQLRPSVYPTGNWGQWTPFGRCTVTCGGGKQTRQRVCYSVTPNRKVPRPSTSGFDPSMLLLLSSLGNNNGSSTSSTSSGLTSLLPLLLGGGGLGGAGGMSNNLLLFSLLPSLTGNSNSSSNSLGSLLPLLLSSGGAGAGAGAGGLSSILPLLLLSGNSNSSSGGIDLSTLLLLQMLQKPTLPITPTMPTRPSCIGSKYDTATCNVVPCVVPTLPPTIRPSPQPQHTPWGAWGNCQMQDNKCVKSRTRNCLSSVCEATKQITYCQNYQCMPVTPIVPVVPVVPVAPVRTCNPIGNRVECGYPGIMRNECEQKGCCFDSSRMDTTWCFQRTSYMRLKSGVQSSPEQASKPSTNSNKKSNE